MSLASVLTMGFQPTGDVGLIVTLGYSQTGEAPPPPPPSDDTPVRYGPALSPAERRRWFGDTDPLTREARRKARERLMRVEIGLEEDEREEIEAQVERKVEAIVAKQERMPETRFDRAAAADRIAKRVAAEMRAEIERVRRERKDAQEEESEAMELLEIIKEML
jgi:hypothetical protein